MAHVPSLVAEWPAYLSALALIANLTMSYKPFHKLRGHTNCNLELAI